MLHVRPNLHSVNMSDANAVFDALLRPLLRVPVFPGVMLPVVIVLTLPEYQAARCLRYPADSDSQRDLTTCLLDTYKTQGLHSFDVCGMTLDDDDEELVTAGEQLLGLLRTHPDAFMRDGSKVVRTD